MKSSRYIALCLAIAATMLTAGAADAQAVAGHFTLPSQTRWGTATLPAGYYTFKLDHTNISGYLTLQQGTNNVAMVMAQGLTATKPTGTNSSMSIAQNRVRSLYLANVGLTYRYSAPKSERIMIEARRRLPGTSIAVAIK